MGLTLQDLRAAMQPLAALGKGELTFEVNGVTISLRALTPEEETDVQRYAREVLADGADLTDQATAWEFLDRFRVASLGYSLVQIGNFDFRDAEYVETGEKLQNGTPIKVRKHEAVRNLVNEWSRPMVVAVYKKFGELMDKVEREVEGLIDFESVDFDAEITRLEDRIRELKEEKKRLAAMENDPRTAIRQQVVGAGKRLPKDAPKASDQTDTVAEADTLAVPPAEEREIVYEDDLKEETQEAREAKEPATTQELPPSAQRKPIFARVEGPVPPPATAPEPATVEEPSPKVLEMMMGKEPTLPAEPAPDPEDPLPEVMSSFVDLNDPIIAEKAIDAENRRIAEMRSRAAHAAAGVRRAPPHLAAKQVAQDASMNPALIGTKDGVEVYKMPTQTMVDRRPPDAPAAAVAPKLPTAGNANPRFRPAKK